MRDGIDHDEARMTPTRSTVRAAKGAAQQSKIRDAELKDLLAHLGRLLAREYVALLSQTRRAESDQEKEAR